MANNDLTNPGTRAIVTAEVRAVLLKHGAPSSLMDEILDRISIRWVHNESFLRLKDDEGSSITIDDYVLNRETDTKYAKQFTKSDPPRISASDQEGLHARFEDIALGKVIVGDE